MQLSLFIKQTKSLLKLAYPILIAQLIQNLMNFSDTVMAGRVSATDMAAVAVASSIWLPIILTINGVIMALASIVSQLAGAEEYNEIPHKSYQTGWIALSLSLLIIIIFYWLTPIITPKLTLDPQLQTLMFDYLHYIIWGGPAFCLYLVLRNYAEGLSITRPTMIISLLGLAINIPANYIFIYGKFGMPALGGAGCGLATAIVYCGMFFGMLFYVLFKQQFSIASLFKRFYWPHWATITSILSLGIPIAFSLLFEVSLFSVVAILLAPFGADIVAGHQVAISYSSLVFMIPLSLASAVTIQVGTAIGRQHHELAKQICFYSIILGVVIAVITAVGSIIFRNEIASIYTHDQQVITLAANLMFLAALFQFSDAIQVISASALRGYKDTTAILIITFIAYWIIGLSVGCILGLTNWFTSEPLGPYGFWIGFISGLTTAAILLAWRLNYIQKAVKHKPVISQ
jgi:MATE family multidrug resistance protein